MLFFRIPRCGRRLVALFSKRAKNKHPWKSLCNQKCSKMITFWLSLFHPSTKRYFHQNCIPYGTFGHFLPFLGVPFRIKNEVLFQGCCFLRFKLRRKSSFLLFPHFLHIFMALWKTAKPFEIEVTVFAVGRPGSALGRLFEN